MLRKTILPVAVLVLLLAVGAGARFLFRESRDVTTTSKAAYEAYQRGLAEYRRYHWVEALEEYQKAIAADSTFAMAYLQLSRAAYSLNDRELAKTCIEKAHALRDGVTEIERIQIDRSFAALNKDHEKLDELFQELVEKYPEHPYTCLARAEKAKDAGKLDEAARCYKKILEVDPERVDIHNLLGYLYMSSGKYDQAITSLQRYAFFAPDLANPHDSLGEAYYYKGDYEASIREYLKSLEIDPTFVNSAAMLSRVLSTTGQYVAARQALDETSAVFHERRMDFWLAWERFRIEFEAKQWDQALEKIDAAMAVIDEQDSTMEDPESSKTGLLFNRAVVQIELGDIEGAHKTAEIVRVRADEELTKNPNPSPKMKESYALHRAYLLSRLARADGSPTGGIAELQEAIAKSTWSPHELAPFRYELALAHFEAGEYAQTVAEGSKLLSAIETAPRMNLLVAKALVAQDKNEEAIPYLTTYVEVMHSADPGNPDVAEASKLLKRLVAAS